MRIIVILGALLILILSPLIYFYPIHQYSEAPAQFNGGGKYFSDYLINTGHFLERGDVTTFGVFSNTIYGQTETPAAIISSVIRTLVTTSSTNFYWNSSLLYYFFATIIFSLSILLFYIPIDGKPVYIWLFVILYSVFGVPYLIANLGGNAGIGWTLVVLILYTYVKRDDERMRLLSLFLMISLPLLYYTPASVMLLIMGTLFIYNIIHKKITTTHNLIFLYFSLWLAISIYISTGRFTGTVEILSNIPIVIKEGLVQSSAGAGSSVVIPYLISTGLTNKIILFINGIFVTIPVVYFVLIGFKKFRKDDKKLHILWSFTLSLIPLAFLLFEWLGFWGLFRLAEWGGLLSILTYSVVAGKICKSHEIILTFFVILAIATATFGYIVDENIPTLYLTSEEEHSANWLNTHIYDEKCVFTDFRIAGYFVGNKHLRVTGVNNIDYPLDTAINSTKAIYYSNNGTEAKRALDDIKLNNGQKVNYLILSDQMATRIPGIKLYDYAFKPAPINFTEKYDRSSFTDRIYDNGKSMNYFLH